LYELKKTGVSLTYQDNNNLDIFFEKIKNLIQEIRQNYIPKEPALTDSQLFELFQEEGEDSPKIKKLKNKKKKVPVNLSVKTKNLETEQKQNAIKVESSKKKPESFIESMHTSEIEDPSKCETRIDNKKIKKNQQENAKVNASANELTVKKETRKKAKKPINTPSILPQHAKEEIIPEIMLIDQQTETIEEIIIPQNLPEQKSEIIIKEQTSEIIKENDHVHQTEEIEKLLPHHIDSKVADDCFLNSIPYADNLYVYCPEIYADYPLECTSMHNTPPFYQNTFNSQEVGLDYFYPPQNVNFYVENNMIVYVPVLPGYYFPAEQTPGFYYYPVYFT
jgi:hypothetical protein